MKEAMIPEGVQHVHSVASPLLARKYNYWTILIFSQLTLL